MPPATSWAIAVRVASSSAVRRQPPAISTTRPLRSALFHDDWLDTGDLGYMADADVYVTGRVKDMIIRAGRNLHPAELEEAVGDLKGVRKGCVAVFASPDPSGGPERLVVMVETRAIRDDARAALRSEIAATAVDLLGVAPDDVVLAPPRTVLKTSSGKIRRAASQAIYQAGKIGVRPRAVWWELARLRLRGAVPSLRRARRAAGDVAFAVYAWVAYMILGLSVAILLLLLPWPQWRWRVARGSVRLLARLTGTAITVHGLDHLPAGTSIAVANHPSWIDPLALASIMPQWFHFVAAEVLEHQGINGFVAQAAGPPVRRTPRARTRRGRHRPAGYPGARRAVAGHLPRRPPRPRPRVAAFPYGRIRGGRPNRRARRPHGHSRDADNTAARAPFPTTRSRRHHRW